MHVEYLGELPKMTQNHCHSLLMFTSLDHHHRPQDALPSLLTLWESVSWSVPLTRTVARTSSAVQTAVAESASNLVNGSLNPSLTVFTEQFY